MKHYVESIFIIITLPFITTFIFYEILSVVMKLITQKNMTPRILLAFLWAGILIAHTISVFLYALVYWYLVRFFHYLPLEGVDVQGFFSYLYYSAVTYASLGLGDIYARGMLRLISSIEVVNGLTLISWSAMFTYFSVQKMWEVHGLPLHIDCKTTKKRKKSKTLEKN
jgi:hypothetical protein